MSKAHTDRGSIYVEHIVRVQGQAHALNITSRMEGRARDQVAAPPEEAGGDDRKAATLRLPKPAWRQLKTLAMDLETSEQKLLALGMNMVFRAARLPELAEDAFAERDLSPSIFSAT